jgi:3-hydroxyacyl-CoA dehydrogenase
MLNIRTVAVIGSGTMGAGIAEVAASHGHQVLIYDISSDAISRAIDGIRQRLASRVTRGKLSADAGSQILARLLPVTDIEALSAADLVIEAASERLEVKKALFAQLAEICPPQTVLTSNTSSISVTAIAADVHHPERVAGLHFFNPAPVMKLVEVVSGLATSPEVADALCELALNWGKQPVRCQSTPGFIVNRVARPFYSEAWRALEEQVAPPEVIDAALREGGGFPMGPLELTDMIGQDVNFAVTCSVFNAFWQERRFLPSLVQQELVLAGRLGKKSGKGVYDWQGDKPDVQWVKAVNDSYSPMRVEKRRDGVTEIDDVYLIETQGRPRRRWRCGSTARWWWSTALSATWRSLPPRPATRIPRRKKPSATCSSRVPGGANCRLSRPADLAHAGDDCQRGAGCPAKRGRQREGHRYRHAPGRELPERADRLGRAPGLAAPADAAGEPAASLRRRALSPLFTAAPARASGE